MGKRIIILFFVCFFVQGFVGTNKVDAVLPTEPVFNDWIYKVNYKSISQRLEQKKSIAKKRKSASLKKLKMRTRIYTKLFPFVIPESYTIAEVIVNFDAYHYHYFLSDKLGHSGSSCPHRGPPSFS